MRTRTSLLFALLLAAPSGLAAQHATRDSLLAIRSATNADSVLLNPKLNLRSKRSLARIKAAADSLAINASTTPVARVDTLLRTTTDTLIVQRTDTLRLTDTIRVVSIDTVVVQAGTPVDTTTTKPDTTASVPPAPLPNPTPTPVVAFSHPFAPPANGTVLAELPRLQVDTTYPAITRRYRCTAVQACLDTAQTGDEILVAPGSVFSNVTVKPTSRTGWIVVRADLPDSVLGRGTMTKARANALRLPAFVTASNLHALLIRSRGHHVRFVGIQFYSTFSGTNTLMRAGEWSSNPADIPHHIVLDRVLADGKGLDLRRAFWFDADTSAVIKSGCYDVWSGISDSQCALVGNTHGVQLWSQNVLMGGHENFAIGGVDPQVPGMLPADIVIESNLICHDAAWYGTSKTVKVLIEAKYVKRLLAQGNRFCNNWVGGQDGTTGNFKTVNQEGTAPWSETADVTIRWNEVSCVGGFMRLSGLPEPEKGAGIPAHRIAIYRNVVDSVNVTGTACNAGGPGAGDALALYGVDDVYFADNWVRNPLNRSAVYFTLKSNRPYIAGNAFGGEYGIKGSTTPDLAWPGGVWSPNVLEPWGVSGTSWPVRPTDATRAALLARVPTP